MFKKIISCAMVVLVLFSNCTFAEEGGLTLSCKSAVLMDSATGTLLYEHNKDEAYPPASVTKIMTLLLIMEDLAAKKIAYEDIVTGSERAKSMGGSTIFLDAGEQMTVHDLVKGICVASANDASVAMAEYVAGSESVFVERMNSTAERLGMKNTHFANTNGLDAEGHVASAYDIALMSRELLKYPDILKFTTIWMDSLRNGQFTLANTNKLIRFYDGATGLKTGSTSGAGCCISATAEREGLSLIAVVMNAPNSKERFADAKTLLDYGFLNYAIWKNEDTDTPLGKVTVQKGESDTVAAVMETPMYALLKKSDCKSAEISVSLSDGLRAPVKKGQVIGEAVCICNGTKVAKTNVIAKNDVAKIGLRKLYKKLFRCLLRI